MGDKICIPPLGVPLPEGVSKICLVPCVAGIFGGAVYVDSIGKTASVATFNLLNIEEIEGDYCTYWLWVINLKSETYTKIELEDTVFKEILVGSGKIDGEICELLDILVTPEPSNVGDKPSGPILMRRGF